jgi:hypothetical protein
MSLGSKKWLFLARATITFGGKVASKATVSLGYLCEQRQLLILQRRFPAKPVVARVVFCTQKHSTQIFSEIIYT